MLYQLSYSRLALHRRLHATWTLKGRGRSGHDPLEALWAHASPGIVHPDHRFVRGCSCGKKGSAPMHKTLLRTAGVPGRTGSCGKKGSAPMHKTLLRAAGVPGLREERADPHAPEADPGARSRTRRVPGGLFRSHPDRFRGLHVGSCWPMLGICWLQVALSWLQDASRSLYVGSRWPQDAQNGL